MGFFYSTFVGQPCSKNQNIHVVKHYLSLVKFSHTIFALPFALLGFFVATLEFGEADYLRLFFLVVLCMVSARNAAMGFNRLVDRKIDAKNERTASREIPGGVIAAKHALVFVVLNVIAFIATTWFINFLCFVLSPVALAIVLGYSYTKRFTWLCHFVLGLGLALAPVGAYLAVGGQFDWIPILLGLAVLTWVSGFDIIYALQDIRFDREQGLHSVPVHAGLFRSLRISEGLHVVTAGLIFGAAYLLQANYLQFGFLLWAGSAIFIGLLFYQHTLVRDEDLSRVNLAFFTTNGIASILFALFLIGDIFI